MQAGRLRYLVTIEEATITQDTTGAPVETWTTFAEVWANIKPLKGRQLFAAKEFHSEITTQIYIRYLEGVLPQMRVVWGDHTYLIDYPPIDIDMRHKEMILLCREIF